MGDWFSRGLEETCLITFCLGVPKTEYIQLSGVGSRHQVVAYTAGTLLFIYMLLAVVVKRVHDVIETLT